MPVEVGLVIKQPWIDLILAGKKTWEIRGSSTKKRGTIALLESGGNCILGYADLVNVVGPLTKAELVRNSVRNGTSATVEGRIGLGQAAKQVLGFYKSPSRQSSSAHIRSHMRGTKSAR